MVLVYLQNAISVSFRSSSYHGTSIGSTNLWTPNKPLDPSYNNFKYAVIRRRKKLFMKTLFPIWSCPKICNQNVEELIGLWNSSVVRLLKRAALRNLDIILQITEHSDTRELLIISTLLQENAIQETLANWRQCLSKLPYCIVLKSQNISVVSQTSDQISVDYWWKGGRLDLNNLQRIQIETKYLSTLSVGRKMKSEMT